MNLLQVSPYVVHPPSDGGSHRAHGLVKEFPRIGGRVDRYCQGLTSGHYREFDLRRTVRVADDYLEHRHAHPAHDIAKLPMLAGFPNVCSGGALRLAPGPLQSLAERADAVLVREPWQVKAVSELVDRPILYSSHNVETERFGELRASGLVDRLAYDRVERLERAALDAADLLVCTSERDAETYRTTFGYGGQVHVAPNATYDNRIRDRDGASSGVVRVREAHDVDPEDTVALFVGSAHPPNVEAVETVLSMPNCDGVHFLIVGTVCDAVESARDDVTLVGFVDDIEPYFDTADVALNPMLSGGGTNVKVLDYLARGVPVVSTPFGVRGLDVVDGEDAIVAEAAAFPQAIAELATDSAYRERLGDSGRALVSDKYTWETVSKELYSVLNERFE